MTAEIIPLKAPTAVEEDEPRIWTCGNCGCQTFMLYEDGTTQCALCRMHDQDQHGGWAEGRVSDEDFDPDMPTQTMMTATDDNSISLQRESIVRAIRDGHNRRGVETTLVYVGYADGGLDTMALGVDLEQPPAREWVLSMLADGANVLLDLNHNDPGPKPE